MIILWLRVWALMQGSSSPNPSFAMGLTVVSYLISLPLSFIICKMVFLSELNELIYMQFIKMPNNCITLVLFSLPLSTFLMANKHFYTNVLN